MKTVHAACLLVCMLSQVVALPLDLVNQCVVGNVTYSAGQSWLEGCSSFCTCHANSGEVIVGCIPMCGLSLAPPGCQLVDHPDKDVENSLYCCPVVECPTPVCEVGSATYADGDSWTEGCRNNCTCHATLGSIGISCDPLCPGKILPVGCELVEDPFKDETNSLNCCPEVKCETGFCEVDDVIILDGTVIDFGDRICDCKNGLANCSPK